MQTNVKRMMAYSSIAQAGYVLIGVLLCWQSTRLTASDALASVVFYVATYMLANIAAFTVVGLFPKTLVTTISRLCRSCTSLPVFGVGDGGGFAESVGCTPAGWLRW